MKIPIHHGDLIREEMEKRGITAAFLARKIPYSEKNIYRLLNKSCIDCITFRKISEILGCDLCELIKSSSEKKEKEGDK